MIELAFPAAYDVRILREWPGAGGMLQFAREGKLVDGGVMIEVTAERETWAGVVSNAPRSVAAARTAIVSSPSPRVLCVAARGDAYFIDVEQPGRWWSLKDAPVVAIRSATTDGLLVLATPQRVVAVGRDGLAWRTPRLAIDGIKLGEPTDGELRGIADPRDCSEEFAVDLRTGHHVGGVEFDDE